VGILCDLCHNYGGDFMKIDSFYEMAPDAFSKVTTHYPERRAGLDEFHARGVLLMAGPLGNRTEGAKKT